MKKLVRDKIPTIINDSGRKAIIRYLQEEEYYIELKKKLQEEVNEFFVSDDVMELCDIEEVLLAIAKVLHVNENELTYLRVRKKEENGGFDKRIYLEKID